MHNSGIQRVTVSLFCLAQDHSPKHTYKNDLRTGDVMDVELVFITSLRQVLSTYFKRGV